MLIDGLLRLSAGQLITATGDIPSTNTIDLNNFRDISIATGLEFNISAGAAFTSATGTVAISVQGSVNETTNFTTYITSPAFLATDLTATFQHIIKMPKRPPGIAKPRYIRLLYTVAIAAFTTGSFYADLVLDAPANFARDSYPAGIDIYV